VKVANVAGVFTFVRKQVLPAPVRPVIVSDEPLSTMQSQALLWFSVTTKQRLLTVTHTLPYGMFKL